MTTASPKAAQIQKSGFTFRTVRFLTGCIVVLWMACMGGCGKKESPEAVLRRFFDYCQQDKINQAYKETTIGFQMEKSERYFVARVYDLGFNKLDSLEIKNAETQKDVAVYTVNLQPYQKDKMQVTARVHHENGGWHVHEMVLVPSKPKEVAEEIFTVRPRTDDTKIAVRRGFTEPVAVEVPSERELQRMTEETLLLFNDAIRRKDFRTFFASTSDRWKTRGQDDDARQRDWKNRSNRLTLAALNLSFKGFLEAQVDFSKIQGAKMILDEPPRLSANGVLAIKGTFDAHVFIGTFPPKPHLMKFKLEYVYETTKWKLFGITVDVEPVKTEN